MTCVVLCHVSSSTGKAVGGYVQLENRAGPQDRQIGKEFRSEQRNLQEISTYLCRPLSRPS